MTNFFNTPNLLTAAMDEAAPWNFKPEPEALAEMRSMSKDKRRVLMAKANTAWNVYTAVRGVSRNLRVNSKDNPPGALRGIVVDYDKNVSDEVIRQLLAQIKEPNFVPNWVERSLSNNVRLVWVFEREALVPNEAICKKLLEIFVQKLRCEGLLPGYDKKSADPYEVWTNGGVWWPVKATPMPWVTVQGILCEVSEKADFGSIEIPLPVVAAEIEKRWPGRWKGPFELNNPGVRFWDPVADNPEGCRVRPDGMQCFTGRVGFMKWEALFGVEWCDNQRAVNLGKAAGDTYFDGRAYWQLQGDQYRQVNREDLILWLKNKGISGKARKGRTVSDVEMVLGHIQQANRVDGAGPLVNRPAGITFLNGKQILNISTVRVLTPTDGMPGPDDFPFLWSYLNNLFANPENLPMDYFLAWLRRYYIAFRDRKRLMGQAVFLCGPRETGKTLMGYRVIKPLLGDTEANPYDYFTGLTTFNDELFETPLLMINDEEATTKEDARQKFIARIKAFVVNPAHAYHPKYCARVRVEWTGRIFITLNDDPNSIGLLPTVNSNTMDKMMFFRCIPRPGGFPDDVEEHIAKELPLFAKWLLEWTPPDYTQATNRMGVESYFDPDLFEAARKLNFYYTFLEILQEWCRVGAEWNEQGTQTWTGSPVQLHNCLGSATAMAASVKDLTPTKTTRSVLALIRDAIPGIEFVDANERRIRVTRELILKEPTSCPAKK